MTWPVSPLQAMVRWRPMAWVKGVLAVIDIKPHVARPGWPLSGRAEELH